MRSLFSLALLVFFLTGCGMFATQREVAFDITDPDAVVDEEAFDAAFSAAEEAWEDRGNVESLEAAITGYQEALEYAADPDLRRQLLERLSRATYLLGDGFLRDDEARQKEVYNESIEYGERCMSLDPAFREEVNAGADADEAIHLLGEEYAGCIYWAALSLGKWATLEGFATRVAQRDRIVNYITAVTELAPEYYYGGADRYWGAYYAILPGFMGKDLDKAAQHFQQALEYEPAYLGTKVTMAERLATEKNDREMYIQLLQEVIDADPTGLPEIEVENRIEQIKAQEMLEDVDRVLPAD